MIFFANSVKSNLICVNALFLATIIISTSCGVVKRDEETSSASRNQEIKHSPYRGDLSAEDTKLGESFVINNGAPKESAPFNSDLGRDTKGVLREERPTFAVNSSRRGVFDDRKYELITPTGEILMAAALKWEIEQELPANAKFYAQPAQCAQNISKVMRLAGFPNYNSASVPGLLAAIKAKGGLVVPLPKDRSDIADVIAEIFSNRIPTGTLVGGCLYKNCSGEAGDGHIAMVGDIDTNGAVTLYHNNWYRPDNENGVWKPQMIPLSWYNMGYKRKFMSTSWINIFRNPPRIGTAYDVSIEMPAIDDLDPTNFYLTLAVPVEVWKEYKSRQAKILDRDGNQVPMENSL